MQTLFGRHIWALRLPTALFSTGCVAVALAYRSYLGRTTCRLAALGIALSPAMSFYGRYAIDRDRLAHIQSELRARNEQAARQAA